MILITKTILEQLGGSKFVAMTGSKNFVSDGNTLRMKLARNESKANTLEITLNNDDTYTVKFMKITAGKLNKINLIIDLKKRVKTFEWIEEKIVVIDKRTGVYADELQRHFTEITGLDTHL